MEPVIKNLGWALTSFGLLIVMFFVLSLLCSL